MYLLSLICFHNKRDHVIPFIMLHVRSISLLMYDIHSKSASPNLLDIFIQVDSVHSSNMLSATGRKFFYTFSRLTQQSHSFS